MNLTIPIMEGQVCRVDLSDSKTHKCYSFTADIHRVIGIDSDKICIFRHDFNGVDQNLMIKGFGRNKRFRKPNIRINERG